MQNLILEKNHTGENKLELYSKERIELIKKLKQCKIHKDKSSLDIFTCNCGTFSKEHYTIMCCDCEPENDLEHGNLRKLIKLWNKLN